MERNYNMLDRIIINKNRGWRGLAEAIVVDKEGNAQLRMIFSFSEEVWRDMLDGNIVMQDEDYYYVLTFDNLEKLPKKTQQRSVLIKNFIAKITNVNRYEKASWRETEVHDWSCIVHHNKNRNNHTTSDWNCIGIRVVPEI